METILSSLINQIKNPWQYIFVGGINIILIYYEIDKQYMLPLSIFCMGIAYLVELIVKLIKNYLLGKLKYLKDKRFILFNLLHMNSEEREFIKICFFNNMQTHTVNGLYNQIYKTLPTKKLLFVLLEDY